MWQEQDSGDTGRRVVEAGGSPVRTRNGSPVVVKRSNRRRRTVSAVWQDGQAVVSIPGHFTATQEREWVARMVERLDSRTARGPGRRAARSDEALMERAVALSGRYLAGSARPQSIRWVGNQNGRWGSATPAHGTIRISDKVDGMPEWVVDYVILHELAHLLEAGHGPRFWALLDGYPDLGRAKAYLEGAAYAMGRALSDEPEGAMD